MVLHGRIADREAGRLRIEILPDAEHDGWDGQTTQNTADHAATGFGPSASWPLQRQKTHCHCRNEGCNPHSI